MTQQEYEQKREQEWRAFCNRHGIIDRGHVILFSAFFDAFDRAYALGKQEGPSKNSSEINRELSKNSSESNPAEPKEDKHFDNILKDGFREHNRLHIASIIMSGLLASGKEKHHVRRALDLADALIAECEKD